MLFSQPSRNPKRHPISPEQPPATKTRDKRDGKRRLHSSAYRLRAGQPGKPPNS